MPPRGSNVTYEEVAKAVQSVESKGETPTILRVKAELGNRGSTTTISKYVKQYKTDRGNGGSSAPNAESAPKPKAATKPKADKPKADKPKADKPAGDKPKKEALKKPAAKPKAPASTIQEVIVTVDPEPVKQADVDASVQKPEGSDQQHQQKGGQRRHDKSRRHDQDNRHDNRQGGRGRHQNKHNRDRDRGDQQGGGRNNNRHQQNRQKQSRHPAHYMAQEPMEPIVQDPYAEFEQAVIVSENLEDMSENQLTIKVRKLEAMINKEQSRTEAAEKMAREAKDYAEAIKNQVAQRIADVKQTMETTITQLKEDAEGIKKQADKDLEFYRAQLEKANAKIASLTKNS